MADMLDDILGTTDTGASKKLTGVSSRGVVADPMGNPILDDILKGTKSKPVVTQQIEANTFKGLPVNGPMVLPEVPAPQVAKQDTSVLEGMSDAFNRSANQIISAGAGLLGQAGWDSGLEYEQKFGKQAAEYTGGTTSLEDVIGAIDAGEYGKAASLAGESIAYSIAEAVPSIVAAGAVPLAAGAMGVGGIPLTALTAASAGFMVAGDTRQQQIAEGLPATWRDISMAAVPNTALEVLKIGALLKKIPGMDTTPLGKLWNRVEKMTKGEGDGLVKRMGKEFATQGVVGATTEGLQATIDFGVINALKNQDMTTEQKWQIADAAWRGGWSQGAIGALVNGWTPPKKANGEVEDRFERTLDDIENQNIPPSGGGTAQEQVAPEAAPKSDAVSGEYIPAEKQQEGSRKKSSYAFNGEAVNTTGQEALPSPDGRPSPKEQPLTQGTATEPVGTVETAKEGNPSPVFRKPDTPVNYQNDRFIKVALKEFEDADTFADAILGQVESDFIIIKNKRHTRDDLVSMYNEVNKGKKPDVKPPVPMAEERLNTNPETPAAPEMEAAPAISPVAEASAQVDVVDELVRSTQTAEQPLPSEKPAKSKEQIREEEAATAREDKAYATQKKILVEEERLKKAEAELAATQNPDSMVEAAISKKRLKRLKKLAKSLLSKPMAAQLSGYSLKRQNFSYKDLSGTSLPDVPIDQSVKGKRVNFAEGFTESEMPIEFRKFITTTIDNILETYGVDREITIFDIKTYQEETGKSIAGSGAAFVDLGNGRSGFVLNPANILAETQRNPDGKPSAYERGLTLTSLHELGHVIFRHIYNNAEENVQEAIDAEYRRFAANLIANRDKHKPFFERALTDYEIAQYPERGYVPDINYDANLEEFTANSFMEFMIDTIIKDNKEYKFAPETDAFFKKVKKVFLGLYKAFSGRFKDRTTFKEFMEAMAIIGQTDNNIEQGMTYDQEYQQIREMITDKVMPVANASMASPKTSATTVAGMQNNLPLGIDDELPLSRININASNNQVDRDNQTMFSLMRNPATSAIMRQMLNPRQMMERFQMNPRDNSIPALAHYVEALQDMNAEKYKSVTKADIVLRDWKNLGHVDASNLSMFLYAIDFASRAKKAKLTTVERAALYRQVTGKDMTNEQHAVYGAIQRAFAEARNGMELSVMIKHIQGVGFTRGVTFELTELYRRLSQDTGLNTDQRVRMFKIYLQEHNLPYSEGFINQISASAKIFSELADRDYFPNSRFGRHVVRIRAEDENGNLIVTKTGGDITGFYTFDTDKEAKEFLKVNRSKIGDLKVDESLLLDDISSQLVSMPAPFIDTIVDAIQRAARENGQTPLTTEQLKAVEEIKRDIGPSKALLKHLNRKNNVRGFSPDAMRTFASYQMSSANNIARILHGEKMALALKELRDSMALLQSNPADKYTNVKALAYIHKYLTDHFTAINSPQNDFARLRQFAFFHYLGFNIKSALVNISQIAMATYPVLTGRMVAAGYKNGIADAMVLKALISGSNKASMKINFTPTAEENAILAALTERGTINQTYVRDLAQTADPLAPNFLVPKKGMEMWDTLVEMSAVPFNISEEFNRRSTMYASIALRSKLPSWGLMSIEAKIKAVDDDVRSTQGEYNREMRPAFMRGPVKSNVFLFMNYVQHMMNIYTGGEGSIARNRALVVLWMIGGITAMPGAQDIESIIEYFRRKYYQNDYKTLREDLRSVLHNSWADPERVLFGLSGRENSLLALANAFGMNVPQVDLSGAISMGHLNPVQKAMYSQDDTAEETFAKAMVSAGGANLAYLYSLNKAMTTDDIDTFYRLKMIAPKFVAAQMEAYQQATEGEYVSATGNKLGRIPMDNMDGRFEYYTRILQTATAFQSTEKTRFMEMRGAEYEKAVFYSLRRTRLIHDFTEALNQNDPVAKREAKQAIDAYNAEVRKNPQTIGQSLPAASIASAYIQMKRNDFKIDKGLTLRIKDQGLRDMMVELYGRKEEAE